jgi:uncharacterized protein VirK/YbjX
MALLEDRTRWPSFAARARHLHSRLKRHIERARLSVLQTAMRRPANCDDIVACYRAILGREPEDAQAVAGHLLGRPLLTDIVAKLAHSGELRAKHLRSNIALDRAQEPDYLAKAFDGSQRVRAYYGHYGFLVEALAPPTLHRLIADHATLYVHGSGGAEHRIVVTATHDRHEEGELQIQLQTQHSILYVLGVTIVPGEVFGLADRHVLLVSRMQGVPGAFLEIRHATKAFGDIHPRAVLFAALQGLAAAFDISAIVGVAATSQIAYGKCPTDALVSGYDDFFTATGGERFADHFFLLRPERQRKAPPLADRAHVKRAERKRRLKRDIAALAASEARSWLKPPANHRLAEHVRLIGSAERSAPVEAAALWPAHGEMPRYVPSADRVGASG